MNSETPRQIPGDPAQLFAAISQQHARSQSAFLALLNPPADTAGRLDLHRQYREATAALLELQRRHNESGLALSPWDLTAIAQPLCQQTMIEADLCDALGESDEAKRLRVWALEGAETFLGAAEVDRLRRGQATQLALDGRFNEALTTLADIRRAFTDRVDVIQAAQTALEEAAILNWLGDDERSLRAIQDARRLVEPRLHDQPVGEGAILSALVSESRSIQSGAGPTGATDEAAALWRVATELVEHEARVHKALYHLDEAERLFTVVLPKYASLGPSGAASIEYQLAAIDGTRGDYTSARARLTEIEPVFSDPLLRTHLSGLRSLQADVALGLDEPHQALELADDGIAEVAQHPDDDIEWRLRWRRGRALAALADPDAALAAYERATSVVDSLRKSPLGYRLDSTSLRAKLPLFDAAIDLAAARGDGPAAARFIELIKARALSSVLSIPPVARGERSELELEFDNVTRRLDALEFQGYRGTADGADVHRQREVLLTRRRELLEQQRLRDPRWRGLSEPAPFAAEQLAESLAGRRQAALTLFRREGHVVSVLLADSEIAVAVQEVDAEAVDLLGQYVRNLVVPRPDPSAFDPAELGLAADTFVPPSLLERALAADSLLIAPHSTLHLLSWPALTVDGRRLFEHTAVGVVPNLTCASALGGEFAAKPRAALAGTAHYEGLPMLGDLPATALELDALSELYTGRLVAPPLIDAKATEQGVKALAARTDADGAILHISCHGTLSLEEPLGSGLLLVDGKLDAAELATTTLHYDEVVLSACSTGWRPQKPEGIELSGDDVLGLPGALLEAGARSIVVSIPKASDEVTRDFMVSYHRAGAAGETPLVAFRETQLQLLASDYDVYKWAGMVCYAVR